MSTQMYKSADPIASGVRLSVLRAMDRTTRVDHGIAFYGSRVPMLERPTILATPATAWAGDVIRGLGGWYSRVLFAGVVDGVCTVIHTEGEYRDGVPYPITRP
jgi:hypothetical protein